MYCAKMIEVEIINIFSVFLFKNTYIMLFVNNTWCCSHAMLRVQFTGD